MDFGYALTPSEIIQIHSAFIAFTGIFVVLRMMWYREDYRRNYDTAMSTIKKLDFQQEADRYISNDDFGKIAELVDKFTKDLPRDGDRTAAELAARCMRSDLKKIRRIVEVYRVSILFGASLVILLLLRSRLPFDLNPFPQSAVWWYLGLVAVPIPSLAHVFGLRGSLRPHFAWGLSIAIAAAILELSPFWFSVVIFATGLLLPGMVLILSTRIR